jgi:hypothetical protein
MRCGEMKSLCKLVPYEFSTVYKTRSGLNDDETQLTRLGVDPRSRACFAWHNGLDMPGQCDRQCASAADLTDVLFVAVVPDVRSSWRKA